MKNNMHSIVRDIYFVLAQNEEEVGLVQIRVKQQIKNTKAWNIMPFLTYKSYQTSSNECYMSVQNYIDALKGGE